MLAPSRAMIPAGGPSQRNVRGEVMGAMKNWAMVCEELDAAREHWESCDAAHEQAMRNETEAYARLKAARADHDAMVRERLNGVRHD